MTGRDLTKSLDDLFGTPERALFRCFACGWETALEWDPYAVLIYDHCPECGDPLGDGRRKQVYREDTGLCRVCGEPASARRTRYCSEFCKEIANAVQRLFLWSSVRERVLDRDGHTCQHCGADVSEGADAEPEVDHIQPVADDGHPFDARNLMTLCGECHGEKTHHGADVNGDSPGVIIGEYLETEISQPKTN